MATRVIPYLCFNGNCKSAVEAYIKAFGGEIRFMSYWGTENCDAPKQWGKVMHAEFTVGDTPFSGGDQMAAAAVSDSIKLMVHMADMNEANAAVTSLAEGGEIISPLAPHPKPDDGGMGAIVRDAFGYTWIITCPNPFYGGIQ